MKIVLAGLLSDKNLGDAVIYECAKFLLNTQYAHTDKVHFAGLDLQGLGHARAAAPFAIRKLRGVCRRATRLFATNRYAPEINDLKKYYRKHVKHADAIVIVGGGLIKYKYQKFWLYLTALILVADELGTPVALSGLGVEGYDDADFRCRTLKDSLNRSVVRIITTRDDIVSLSGGYLRGNDSIDCYKVADPAVWSGTVYNVDRDEASKRIGIGLVRGDIFVDNNVGFSRERLVEFYVDLLNELDARRIPWQAFTNGLPRDLDLTAKIFTRLTTPRSVDNVSAPLSAKELVTTISGFRGVIGARLHANIIAYSLGIPSVGLVWNNKLIEFGRQIRHPERFFQHNELDAGLVVDCMLAAIAEGNDPNLLEEHKSSIRSSAYSILKLLRDKDR
jgi:polysaccharide pyruvyl transferase WcaK-like protein